VQGRYDRGANVDKVFQILRNPHRVRTYRRDHEVIIVGSVRETSYFPLQIPYDGLHATVFKKGCRMPMVRFRSASAFQSAWCASGAGSAPPCSCFPGSVAACEESDPFRSALPAT